MQPYDRGATHFKGVEALIMIMRGCPFLEGIVRLPLFQPTDYLCRKLGAAVIDLVERRSKTCEPSAIGPRR
jgi:hypothetical protein